MTDDNIIDSVCERIKFDRDKLEGDGLPRIEVDSFNLSEFWPQFESAVQALSNQTTKVSFMCHTKPFPPKSDVSTAALDILQYYNIMRDLYLVLPEEVGFVVFKATTTAVLDIAKALHNVIRSYSELTEKASEERMKLIGTFWDACNSVQSLPKNNLLATLNLFEEESALASDALEELNTTIEEDAEARREGENPDGWTDAERGLASQAVGLVKVTHTCVKRLRKAVASCGSCSSAQNCKQLDATVEAVRRVSPALDDFVSELYHPVNVPVVMENRLVPNSRGNFSHQQEDYRGRRRGSIERTSVTPPSHLEREDKRTREPRKYKRRMPHLPEKGIPGGLDDPLRRGLSGAGTRWYLRFLECGLSPKEARKKAEERKMGRQVGESIKRYAGNRERITF